MVQFKSAPIHRTPLYRAKAAWRNMRRRCENKDGCNPSYTRVKLKINREAFVEWALPFYEKITSRGLIPTVSRIGDQGHYEIGNIEILPKGEHKRRENQIRWQRVRPVPGKKRCSSCHRVKKMGLFAKRRTSKDGYGHWCKACVRKYNEAHKEQRNMSRRKRRALIRERSSTDQNGGPLSRKMRVQLPPLSP
jgi:hypothetical protein